MSLRSEYAEKEGGSEIEIYGNETLWSWRTRLIKVNAVAPDTWMSDTPHRKLARWLCENLDRREFLYFYIDMKPHLYFTSIETATFFKLAWSNS